MSTYVYIDIRESFISDDININRNILNEKLKKEQLKSRSLVYIVFAFSILIFSSAFLMTATIYMPQHQAVAQTSNVPFSQYNAQQFSIQYPTGSQVVEGEKAGVFAFITPDAGIFVKVSSTASNDTLNQATNRIIGSLQTSPHFTLLEQKSISLANNTGFSIVFTSADDRGRDIVTKSVWTVSGGTVYVLRFSAVLTSYYDIQTQAILNKMIDSFQINQGNSQDSGIVLNHTGSQVGHNQNVTSQLLNNTSNYIAQNIR